MAASSMACFVRFTWRRVGRAWSSVARVAQRDGEALVPGTAGVLAPMPAKPLLQAPMQEPAECASFRYSSPPAVASAFRALAEAPFASNEKRNRALQVIRGCLTAPCPQLRAIGSSLTSELSVAKGQDVDGLLFAAAADASEAYLEFREVTVSLVQRLCVPVDALITAFAGHDGITMLQKIRPMDVLDVSDDRPSGYPPSAHAYLCLLKWRGGPLFRNKDYIRVAREEREHFSWVFEQVRALAPEFYSQYCTAELQAGKSKWFLVLEADRFLTVLSEKMFALALVHHLPDLMERQRVIDSAGSTEHRWQFAKDFCKAPPPLMAVGLAFGIDARQRSPNLTADTLLADWQRSNLWTRRRTYKLKESAFPTLREFGDMALATPLRHRPFASFLAELNAVEEPLLRDWYGKAQPEEPVLHVLWSHELVRELSDYVAKALTAAAQAVASREANTDADAYRILCVGSGASRLCHYLRYILPKVLGHSDIRVAAIVPSKHSASVLSDGFHPHMLARWPPEHNTGTEQHIHPAEAGYTLDQALEAYRPRLVICACMPPRIDWSASLRRAATVLEYLLIGPADTNRSGDLCATWGGPEPFKTRGRSPERPPFVAQGFVRHDLPHLSNLCIGTDDTPGRVGINLVVAFRHLLRPKFLGERPPQLTLRGGERETTKKK
eukprot:TRINITY_DN77938_c0_g1_i1.p1 TRINITY_DN77938_c0_g1~~TRINITY_DN77938_c0_g1_i1.p1  ORF type:complete len:668 (-),score=81.76 TRINITY_DN77938_c0_g1_i1:11-2014(-)